MTVPRCAYPRCRSAGTSHYRIPDEAHFSVCDRHGFFVDAIRARLNAGVEVNEKTSTVDQRPCKLTKGTTYGQKALFQ